MSLAPFAAIEQRIAAATLARLANAYVVLSTGQAFGAELNRMDESAFGAVTACAETLVYPAAYGLQDGEEVSINGSAYRVSSVPRKSSEQLATCEVVRT